MESTAQYWKPVWEALERYWQPACESSPGQSPCREACIWRRRSRIVRGAGRKNDFGDAERLVRRLCGARVGAELCALCRAAIVAHGNAPKAATCRTRVRLQNQMEAFLEEAHIKLSSLVSDLLGESGRRMMEALAEGETDPAALAAKADRKLRASPSQLCDALGAARELKTVYRQLLKQSLEELQLLEKQIGQLDQEIASLLWPA